MKTHKPPLGRYSRDEKYDVNGTVLKYRRWRKKRMRMQRESRRINRARR
jgi:hypothetical protein